MHYIFPKRETDARKGEIGSALACAALDTPVTDAGFMALGLEPAQLTVAEIMSKDLVTISDDQDTFDTLERLRGMEFGGRRFWTGKE